MVTFLTIAAILGLIIFAVGAVLWLVQNPAQPRNALIMVVGGLVFSVAQVILYFMAAFPG